MSPVPWRIVKLENEILAPLWDGKALYSITAEAPPEVVPAVWTHEGCETCGGREQVDWAWADIHGNPTEPLPRPCPDGRLVPWKGEEE